MNTLPKVKILEQISEDQILKFYLPGYIPNVNTNYRSPFSEKDDNPSLSVYKDDTGLKFKSHNTGHQGDVFQFVADLKGIDCKSNFHEVLAIIEADLGVNMPKQEQKRNLKISFEKEFTDDFLQYFASYKVTPEVLNYFDVRQVKYHEFISNAGKLCKFDYRRLNQLVVGYRVNNRIKTYTPFIVDRQKKAFGFKDQIATDVFGLKQLIELGKVNQLFLAAGEKDCLVLNAHGFKSIAFQSENTIPSDDLIEQIKTLADKIYIIYDNDLEGKRSAAKLHAHTGFEIIMLPEGVKDVADYFLVYTNTDFEKLSLPKPNLGANGQENGAFTIFHLAEKFLVENYDLRFNTIKLEIEYRHKGSKDFIPLNENDLYVTMNKRGIKIGMDKLIAILKSSFVEKFNPLQEYFKSLPAWDQSRDYIEELANHLHSDIQPQLNSQFKKWIVRTVRGVMHEGTYNKQAFILVHSQQNSGKTSFCRFLCPPILKEYMAENISDDKDSRIAIAKNFIINLDELSSLAKHEINSLKALFSKDVINERLPYDRKTSIIHRVASFIGSTNMAEFLTDETGSVRWLCFEIKHIDWSYREKININHVWAQAYALLQSGFVCDMDKEDIEQNEQRNSKFQQRSPEAELIPKMLAPSNATDPLAHFMTATDVLIYLTIFSPLKLNKISVGRAMPICGFKRAKDTQSDRYGYWAIKLKGDV